MLILLLVLCCVMIAMGWQVFDAGARVLGRIWMLGSMIALVVTFVEVVNAG